MYLEQKKTLPPLRRRRHVNTTMPLTTAQMTANEQFYTQMIMFIRVGGTHTWSNTGNIYYKQENGKMRPTNLKGYVELRGIVGREWFKAHVEYPANSSHTINLPNDLSAFTSSTRQEAVDEMCDALMEGKKKKTRRGGKKHKKNKK